MLRININLVASEQLRNSEATKSLYTEPNEPYTMYREALHIEQQ